jgi:hypothetical protein
MGVRILGIFAAIIALLSVLFVAFEFGLLNPVLTSIATAKVSALEQHLFVGETRTQVESQFGRAIDEPNEFRGYDASGSEVAASAPDWDKHLGEYSYASSGSFCFAGYTGVVVYYDRHDRVKFWKRFDWGEGC